MLLDMMTNEIMWRGYAATILQVLSFIIASSVKHIFHQHCLVFILWNRWKNLLSTNRKVRSKNQISEYRAPSFEGYDEEDMRLIDEKLSNPVENWGGKPEYLWSVIDEKPPNLQIEYFLGG